MEAISRKNFLIQMGLMSTATLLFNGCNFAGEQGESLNSVKLDPAKNGEDIFSYIQRNQDKLDFELYRKIIGAANEFKEGDLTLGLAAADEESRRTARELLGNTKVKAIDAHLIYEDDLYNLVQQTTQIPSSALQEFTLGELKTFILEQPEAEIKRIMPALSSDVIGCVVKLMSNEELILVGQKVFNPLAGSKIGSKGYLSARVQPNSPTDHPDDIAWQVFDAWSYAVGDLVLGTNPVSGDPVSVAKIEATLYDILQTFRLEETLSNCVLSHIDVQAKVEQSQPGTTGIWFQSLAGTVAANKTFDVTIKKMQKYTKLRNAQYGLYAETGQGADFTNGHGAGFDMVLHESRKYGFVRALQEQLKQQTPKGPQPWVHVNDVAGFIGPEVFKTREQLVRCCLEDTVMGKLHGLTIGLDICSTLHMDISLDDLSWCIEQLMPANPAYLMALPTKNDPMLSYLTTSFADHVRIREKFGYKVNDAMWEFFKELEIIDAEGKPTEHFGDPKWVYYKFRQAKGDSRSKAKIDQEASLQLQKIRNRGVSIAEGYGDQIWDLDPQLEAEVKKLYEDAKESLWTPMAEQFANSIENALLITTRSEDRKDYVYHPESGEELSFNATSKLKKLRQSWSAVPDVQIIISDGLNARALMDEGHLKPFLITLKEELKNAGLSISTKNLVVTHGRVRAGYACGEHLFGTSRGRQNKAIVHIIGERPGSGHHNYSAYLTAAPPKSWSQKRWVDHDITRVVSGISDTALDPELAAQQTATILTSLLKKDFRELKAMKSA
ncbi:ethanolamine ammonia-lyase light chain /ethanolamine ammonia-lyase heavy chain [Leeuwenhoekiella aestuarii]|uniref:ethanolamine ammonia-lyase subunit EutB n=1 Tax=Leeuwenhoekiella aestuarii TaxID=2249426 RepID=UPI000FFEF876|nr:ethanolamine ammonia-lyase subunit EutB [Leeuwenhoekiella aestuarii]RXG16025.1 ethanolamine ammonia-lyase light chain /ethanolamine ammonia-lyase heavy chain [Leeuwenhoekiella aestuarii]